MMERSPQPALQDIVEAIARIRGKLATTTLPEFEADWEMRWMAERGTEITSEASRRLPNALKDRHPDIPWNKVAGIENVLRHEYDEVSARILWAIFHHDLPPLEKACREELEKLR